MSTNLTLEQQLVASEKKSQEIRNEIEKRNEANKPIGIMSKINGISDVLEILGADEGKDVIKIDKFDEAETNVIKNVIKKMRIVKVYNEGHVFKRGDKRHYPYYDISSGFVFSATFYDNTNARTTSAPRLAFKNRDLTLDYVKKFNDVEQGIIEF
mgnify:CR=1 FL=1